jgi:hypothetical protein
VSENILIFISFGKSYHKLKINMKSFYLFNKMALVVLLSVTFNVANAQKVVYNTVTGQVITENQKSSSASLLSASVTDGQTVIVSNGWNNNAVGTVGASGSDFYAQSFIATESMITKFGVVAYETSSEGQLILSIVADNGSGVPDYANPLYEGTLINPTSTSDWYYESGINVPVTIGQKYYILIDGYNNAEATGASRIGLSSTYPIASEGMIYSNSGGVGAWSDYASPIAIYVEGTSTPAVPVSIWTVILAFAAIGVVTFIGTKRKLLKL